MNPSPESTQRWKLTVSYDGQPFQGWQSQPSGNTIQDLLEAALSHIFQSPSPRVHGAGRTDAGVHAEGQVAHFDAPASLRLGPENWVRALNVRLPPQIRVLDCSPVRTDFHARFSVTSKTYRYELYLGEIVPPHLFGRVWPVRRRLNEDQITEALATLVGCHDFRCFSANRGKRCPPPRSTERTVYEARLSTWGDSRVALIFRADGFLYKMVRLLVGTLVKFSEGKLSRDEWRAFVEAQAPGKTSACAPPTGLYLVSVCY